MKKPIVGGAVLAGLVILLGAGSAAGSAQAQQQQPQPPPEEQKQEQNPPFGMPTVAAPTAEERSAIQKIKEIYEPRERLTLVEEFLAKYPESSLRGEAYTAASEAYRIQNNYEKSIEYGEKALALNPQNIYALIFTADSLAESALPAQPDYQDRLARAEEYGRRALDVLPQAMAGAVRPEQIPEDQFKIQQQYVEAQPHATLGFVYLRRNELAQAEEELTRAIELNQLRPSAYDYLRLAVAQLRLREYAEAEPTLTRCTELGGPAAETCQRQLLSVRRLLKTQEPADEKKPQE